MATDELDNRVRYLESEVEGEKAVTRHVLEQLRRNTTELTVFRSESGLALDRLSSDVVLVKAAQVAQGGMLNILVQDTRQIRTEMGAIRMEISEVRAEMGAVRAEIGEVRTEMGEVRTEIGEVRTEMGAVRTEMGAVRAEMNRRFDAVAARFDALEQNVATILAAVAPQSPSPGGA